MILAALAYLLAINLATFAAFAFDKRRAVLGGRRVRERTLLGLAAAGGTLGAFAGQAVLRHKSRKTSFVARLWVVTILQVIVTAWVKIILN